MKKYIILLLLFVASVANGDEVRRSTNGICHDALKSSYYNRLKYFVAYNTMEECLYPDGRTTKFNDVVPKYNRRSFGSSWIDADRDGQNTRAEELIRESTGQVSFTDSSERIVARGRWISTFTNDILTHARTVDVDHIVALKWAWDHGAYQWDYDQRVAFANDTKNLAAVEQSLNRSKGARGPDEWLPPENKCAYLLRFIRLYRTYGLKISIEEANDFALLRLELC